jgi:uncharacterized membrane protein
MGYVLVISWILGIVLSILFGIGAWIAKDKKAWEASQFMFLIALFTGYITTILFICAFILLGLNKRFD